MKILVTQADLEKLIKESFKIDGACEIQFVGEGESYSNYSAGLSQVIKLYPRYLTDQKIQAIKRLRELVPGLGLGDAKTAVENAKEAISYHGIHRKPLPFRH